jgi:hypothetical protein
MKNIKASMRGAFTYLPLSEIIKNETTRESVFGKGHIWRELLWIKLHEYISRKRHEAKLNVFLKEIGDTYGDAPMKEANNFIQSLEYNGLLKINADDNTIRTEYGDWFIDKQVRRIASCIKASEVKWKVNPKARPKKNEEVKKESEEPKKEIEERTELILELKTTIEKAKKKKTISIDSAIQFYKENIHDEVLCEALCEHLEVRQAKRVPNTHGALRRLVKRLNDLSLHDPIVATAIVEKSIRSGWADVFELKEVKSKTNYTDIYEQLKSKYSN